MLFMVDGKIYDSHETPLGVLLTSFDKEKIKNMPDGANCYIVTPGGVEPEELEKMADSLKAAHQERMKSNKLKEEEKGE